MACESHPNWQEADPAQRFVNLKAQYYQELADALERDQVQGLRDDVTIGQLAGLLYEFDSHGRIKIESKESARARGMRSPDRAEALMLALCKPPMKIEYYSIRDLSRLSANSALNPTRPAPNRTPPHPYWGFYEVPDDDEDEMFIPPRRWRRGQPGW